MEILNWRWAQPQDVPKITKLVNAAYKELADLGLNYTATYQDDGITLSRISKGRAIVVLRNNQIVATIAIRNAALDSSKRIAYLGQFGVLPELKRQGLGSRIMGLVEAWAHEQGYQALQLDTAKPAEHLVRWYQSRGYQIISETRFEGKTYESWIFEKPLAPTAPFESRASLESRYGLAYTPS